MSAPVSLPLGVMLTPLSHPYILATKDVPSAVTPRTRLTGQPGPRLIPPSLPGFWHLPSVPHGVVTQQANPREITSLLCQPEQRTKSPLPPPRESQQAPQNLPTLFPVPGTSDSLLLPK